MCDFVPGEVIISFPRHEALTRIMDAWFHDHGEIEHAVPIENMGEVIRDMRLSSRTYELAEIDMRRIQVPPGQEHFKMNFLRDRYMENLLGLLQEQAISFEQFWPWLFQFSATPNSLISSTADSFASGDINALLTEHHQRYKGMVGLTAGTSRKGEGIRIGILDSGIANPDLFKVVRERDFTSRERFGRPGEDLAPDLFGHGTVVATMIRDIVPEAELVIYKVLDTKGRGTEWEAIAGLLTLDDVHIINMSLQYGHNKLDCKECGRRTRSSRSLVFEQILDKVREYGGEPLVVAAAGNLRDASLTFPARFPTVVAVGALNEFKARSSFSNYGAKDHLGDDHPNLFFLPGGEKNPQEAVAYTNGTPWWGTSFSCAYASAIMAIMLSELQGQELLQHLRASAVKDIVGYKEAESGNGMMVLSLPSMQH